MLCYTALHYTTLYCTLQRQDVMTSGLGARRPKQQPPRACTDTGRPIICDIIQYGTILVVVILYIYIYIYCQLFLVIVD